METCIQRTTKARILPNFTLLALCDLALMFLPRQEFALILVLFFILFYLAFIVLITKDALQNTGNLHHIDRVMCRWRVEEVKEKKGTSLVPPLNIAPPSTNKPNSAKRGLKTQTGRRHHGDDARLILRWSGPLRRSV